MPLPQDPAMLLSYINMKLRDVYPSLAALCDDLQVSQTEICGVLSAIGYTYDEQRNAFV